MTIPSYENRIRERYSDLWKNFTQPEDEPIKPITPSQYSIPITTPSTLDVAKKYYDMNRVESVREEMLKAARNSSS